MEEVKLHTQTLLILKLGNIQEISNDQLSLGKLKELHGIQDILE